jgi:hypothetical protein
MLNESLERKSALAVKGLPNSSSRARSKVSILRDSEVPPAHDAQRTSGQIWVYVSNNLQLWTIVLNQGKMTSLLCSGGGIIFSWVKEESWAEKGEPPCTMINKLLITVVSHWDFWLFVMRNNLVMPTGTVGRVNTVQPGGWEWGRKGASGMEWLPKHVYAQIPASWEYVTFLGKRDFKDVIRGKDLEVGEILGYLGAQCLLWQVS